MRSAFLFAQREDNSQGEWGYGQGLAGRGGQWDEHSERDPAPARDGTGRDRTDAEVDGKGRGEGRGEGRDSPVSGVGKVAAAPLRGLGTPAKTSAHDARTRQQLARQLRAAGEADSGWPLRNQTAAIPTASTHAWERRPVSAADFLLGTVCLRARRAAEQANGGRTYGVEGGGRARKLAGGAHRQCMLPRSALK